MQNRYSRVVGSEVIFNTGVQATAQYLASDETAYEILHVQVFL